MPCAAAGVFLWRCTVQGKCILVKTTVYYERLGAVLFCSKVQHAMIHSMSFKPTIQPHAKRTRPRMLQVIETCKRW
jgi:hypothetical protein